MASPGQRRGSCGHAMALFDSHTKYARCREKGIGKDACCEKKSCTICDSFSEEQRRQLATPTYRVRKELQKKTGSPSQVVDPADVTVCRVRLRARVTLVIKVKPLPKKPRSPLTSPLPRRSVGNL